MIIDDAGGLVFRPPSEARSFILRVTIGCSHNTCRFCAMYKNSAFRIRPLEEIDGIIERGAAALPFIRRVFLADGDALVLPTKSLLHILEKCYASFPSLTRVGAYATPADLNRKTPEELEALRKAGLQILYMGIESGDDGVLTAVDKGTTGAETIAAGKKALAAGMKLSAMILLGLGGKERTTEHALHTAAVISAINPTMLSALTLIIPDNVPLYGDVQNGTFTPLTARGFLKELEMILQHTEMKNPCIFRSNHVSNLYPVGGTLPMDKEKMLAALQSYIPMLDDTVPLLNDNGNF
ncbi:radical SAM protein [Megasphaera vaginalis (ex Srinivasan et al. 2021)]|uniref:Radical SAM domain protein n=1 Tax=Megasphaera vaginalis (ex Srinivasan et al. 2021) TaxID=1111454 RepID=U7UIF0_9FIRM|nr:radical SAM protein [Megasphaera vaginalis (ex Srinivasan et al. 2021)]ERT59182.1 radical SAM domain protein [Megasphaera vaginalis (ex Srinivasan et al. 2021)]